MPKFELEIDDKGEFIGQLPTEFTSVLDKIKTTAHGEGYGKGNAKAAEEAKAQIDAAIKAEKLKLEAAMPLEKAKWDEIDQQNKHLKAQIDSLGRESQKRATEREEAHATELTRRMKQMETREGKIRALVNSHLRFLAASAGARDESLPELEVILQHRIGYDDDMEPFVKAEDGSPAKTAAGNPLSIDAFVKQYLDNHAHHRKLSGGTTAGRVGAAATLRVTGGGAVASLSDAKARFDNGDRSTDAINAIFEAGRKKSA
jgi:hypothetical protein